MNKEQDKIPFLTKNNKTKLEKLKLRIVVRHTSL